MTPEQVAARLGAGSPAEIVLLAEVDGLGIGFACLQVLESVCYGQPWAELMEMYVRATHRRRGAGRALIQVAEKLAQARGATDVILGTGAENAAGQAFYHAMGYSPQGDLILRKSLKR
jgi:GNAT superfamily N-acetyltransferase